MFPNIMSVLNPLKKQLTFISFMSFKKISLILTSYVHELSLPEMLVLLNFLIEMNESTRKLKRIIGVILLLLVFFGIYRFGKWVFHFLEKRRAKKNDKKEKKF